MNRTRALIVSLAVGVAAIAGVFALGHTVALGNQARATPTARSLGARLSSTATKPRSGELWHRSPRSSRPCPRRGLVRPGQSAVGSAAASAPAVRVVYHRPPPIVVVKHRAGGEHDSEAREAGQMTDTSHRLYAVAIAVVVFFVSWATVAAQAVGDGEARPAARRPRAAGTTTAQPTRSSCSRSSTTG